MKWGYVTSDELSSFPTVNLNFAGELAEFSDCIEFAEGAVKEDTSLRIGTGCQVVATCLADGFGGAQVTE